MRADDRIRGRRSSASSRRTRTDTQAIVVSFAELAGDPPISPRVQRTTQLTAAFEREFGLRVVRVPEHLGRAARRGERSGPRGLARKALHPVVLDHLEIPARRMMRGWEPSGRGALLIGWPFSPIYVAASHLAAAGIPYVVDVGDPWVLTEPTTSRLSQRLALQRARAAETFLWRHAAAGVVTTETQAEDLRALYPELELLVRPNGYLAADEARVHDATSNDGMDRTMAGVDGVSGGELRLVHFGAINSARVPIGTWLSSLRGSSGIRRVRFVNYGAVSHPELLQTEDAAVVVEVHEPIEWGRACQIARTFDAGVVIANANPAKLPSKAIQYLTLPVPRIALTTSGNGGELAAFAARRPGFIAVGLDSREDIPRMLAHLRRRWSDEELGPSSGDSWHEVAREVVSFAISSWGQTGHQGAHEPAERIAAA